MSAEIPNTVAESIADEAWDAIQGAMDLQVHVAPDVIARRTDDVDLARDFLARGLRGFVLKSHYIPTAERARVVARAVPGIESFGAIALNHSVGGLNPVAVEAEFPSQNLTGEEQSELAQLGATIEHCFTTSYTNKAPWEAVFANIRQVGIESTMISTDLGQATNPPVAEGFAMFAQRLLGAGFSAAEIRTMSATIPASLVG